MMELSLSNKSIDGKGKGGADVLTASVNSPLLRSRERSIQKSLPEAPKIVKGSSWYATIILLVNTCVGAGMLNMAAAYNHSGGLPVGIGGNIVLCTVLSISMVILCYCSDFTMCNTFQDTVYAMCGQKAMVAASIASVFYAFGLVVSFMIVIGDQLDIFLVFTYGPTYCDHWYLSRPFTMFTTICLFVLPLCYPARIDFLKYASFVGFVGIFYTVAFLIARYIISVYPSKGAIEWGPRNFPSIFAIVPVTLFAYQVHLSIVPIYSCLEKRTMRELGKVLIIGMPLIFFAFTASGSFGYLSFGTHVRQDVLLSYRPVTADLLVATILIAGKMYTDAPILSFVGRTAVDSIYCYLRKMPQEDIVKYELRRRIIIASVWFAIALTLAIALPHIGVVIAVMGGFAALVSMIIPGICLLQALLKGYININNTPLRIIIVITSGFYIVVGTFFLVIVVVKAIIVDIHGGPPVYLPANSTCS